MDLIESGLSGGLGEPGENPGDELGGSLKLFRGRTIGCGIEAGRAGALRGELDLIFQAGGLGGLGDGGRCRIRLSFLGLSRKLGLIFRVARLGGVGL